MKAKLTYDLPNEKDEFTAAIKGMGYFLALFEVDNLIRATARGKNSIVEVAEDGGEVADVIAERFYEILDNYNISMDEIS